MMGQLVFALSVVLCSTFPAYGENLNAKTLKEGDGSASMERSSGVFKVANYYGPQRITLNEKH